MKRLLCALLTIALLISCLPAALAEGNQEATLSILATRHVEGSFTDINDLWWFKYLKHYLAGEGWDVTFELEQTLEPEERISLLLATDDLPDVLWGGTLMTNVNQVIYGAGEGMLMDWTPYFNAETMPNAYGKLAEYAGVFTLPNGAIYSMPRLSGRVYYTSLGSYPTTRCFVNTKWLEQCNLEMPTTLDGFIDMLRAFKGVTSESGETWPVCSIASFIEDVIWNALGFYGSNEGANTAWDGTDFAIRDGKLELPCYTEQYKEFLKYMNILYSEGLIHPDHFTLDEITKRGMMSEGLCGVFCDWTMALSQTTDAYADYVCYSPLSSDSCEKPVGSLGVVVGSSGISASAKTEHPELIAKIVDYMYTDMGSMLYNNGPMQGTEECLGVVDGWYLDEQGNFCTKKVDDGEIEGFDVYRMAYIYPAQAAPIDLSAADRTAKKLAGYDSKEEIKQVTDAVTGTVMDVPMNNPYNTPSADAQWRVTSTNAWIDNVTAVSLPAVFLSEEENTRVTDLATAIETYVSAETTKFIIGTRSMDEVDAFFEKLRALGVEEYCEIYRNAYSSYLNSIFG